MPIRSTRPRKGEGLIQFIPMLYERPALRFLKFGEPWADLADLMFGPDTSLPDPELLERLKPLWVELREDILRAQAEYAPDKKPWGCRFDGRAK